VNIAEVLGISHDKIYSLFQSGLRELLVEMPRYLLRAAKQLIRRKRGWLIVDDSTVNKMFGELFEGASRHYNSSTGTLINGHSIVTIAWTDGEITIPLLFAFYFCKEISADSHKTKIQLAKELIFQCKEKIDCKGVLMDGLYCSAEMIEFLNANNIEFEMRMHSNRKVKVQWYDEISLKKHPALKLNRNERSKTVKVIWKGLAVFVTIEKRKDKNGDITIVFLVSNRNVNAKCHISTYALRWGIEMLFRTLKQSIGLEHCQGRSIESQTMHIYASLFSYLFLQYYRLRNGLLNVESALKHLLQKKPTYAINCINTMDQIFAVFA